MKKVNFIFITLGVLPFLVNVSGANELNSSDGTIMIAGVVLDDNNSQQPQLFSDSKGRKEIKSGTVKITPTISSHKMRGMPEQDLFTIEAPDESVKKVNNRSIKKHTQVKKKKKEQLIEGYKIGRNGEDTVYVHGEITENKKGYISGYLYDKKGSKTYIYGSKTNNYNGNNGDAGIQARDNDSNNYILDSR
ncbi:MAG: hypothetical protein QNL62_05080 [Gammaproteobacteria bacterium]|nr:hypothetical protein [Gammaproteobacteria bacterium]